MSDPATWQFAGSGYKDPATGNLIDLATCQFLAQLAANIVDQMDSDNSSTVFNWSRQQNDKNIDYVFGVEQPRVVINEAYVSFDNDSKDSGLTDTPKKAGYFRMNVFFELLNPTAANAVNLGSYRVAVAKSTSGVDSGTGTGMPSNLFTDDLNNPIIISNWPGAFNPLPANANSFSTTGFMLVGPPIITAPKSAVQDNFIPSLDSKNGTSSFPNRRPQMPTPGSTSPDYQEPLLSIKVQPDANTGKPTKVNPTVVLQRLADPNRGFSDDFTKPATYNPWLTVDYFENVWTNDSYVTDGNGDVNPAPANINTLVAYGRKHPLKASNPLPATQPSGAAPTVPVGIAIAAQSPSPPPANAQTAEDDVPTPQRDGCDRLLRHDHDAVRLVSAPRPAVHQSRRTPQRERDEPGPAHAQVAGRGDGAADDARCDGKCGERRHDQDHDSPRSHKRSVGSRSRWIGWTTAKAAARHRPTEVTSGTDFGQQRPPSASDPAKPNVIDSFTYVLQKTPPSPPHPPPPLPPGFRKEEAAR